MQRLLNTQTQTVHTPRDERSARTAACGSLKYVPRARIQLVADEDLGPDETVARCGNCFEEAGGY